MSFLLITMGPTRPGSKSACVGSQSFEKLSASDRGYSKAKVAQKDVLFSTAESKDLTLQADSSTGSAPEASRIFNLAFLSGSTGPRTHSKNRAKTKTRCLNR